MKARLLILCALAFVVAVAQLGDAALSEAEFRRMKIKDLRQFLDERGLACPGCQEKSDFVRVAFQNRDKAPVASKQAREIPKTPFWDAWSDNVKRLCEEATTKRGKDPSAVPYSTVCSTIASATESFLMQNGKRVASTLKKTPDHLLKTSYKGVYYDAGVIIFQKLINYCLASSSSQAECESTGFVVKKMQSNDLADYKAWVTNVGIENTNPMFEIVDDGADL